MPVSALAALCAAVVVATDPPSDAPTKAQEPPPNAEPHRPPGPALDTQGKLQLHFEPAANPMPQMRWDQDVYCGEFAPTASVSSGQYRLQCDPAGQRCLVSPNHVLDSSGVETDEELSRTQPCSPRLDWSDVMSRGARFVPAIAEVQPGWIRDERGRAMQYNFDMNRRGWLGASYSPMWSQLDPGVHRLRAEIGLEVESPSEDLHTMYRWHILEGQIYLGVPSYDITALRLDWSSSRNRPVMFLTTFIGEPKRHDLYLDLGGWFETMHLEWLRRGGETESFLTFGSANLTADLWHSKDLSSYVRLRGGPGAEYDTIRKQTWLKPELAVEADVTLDADGFHHVRLAAEGEKLYLGNAVAGRDPNPERLRLQAEYEVIAIAINDQPLSLVVGGKGVWRNDFATVPAGWEVTGEVGIRFSLWAPARRTAPLVRSK